MQLINRSQLILKPKDCLKALLAYDDKCDWNQDNYVILVPDLQDKIQCMNYLKTNKRYKNVFDEFLALEFYGEQLPIDTSCFHTFLQWFDIQFHGMIFDITDDYLNIKDLA